MQGEIKVNSEFKVGTSFIIKIPFSEADPPLAEASSQEHAAVDLKNSKILYVEDVYTNQILIQSILENYNAKCDTVEKGDEAIKLCEKEEYDLILMDIQLPGMDGFAVTDNIRKMDYYKSVPIVGYTASISDDTKRKSVAFGMNDLISKPIDLKKLDQILIKYIINRNKGGDSDSVDLTFFKKAFPTDKLKLKNYLTLLCGEISEFKTEVAKQDQNRNYANIRKELHKIEPIIFKLKYDRFLINIKDFKECEPFSKESRRKLDEMVRDSTKLIKLLEEIDI